MIQVEEPKGNAKLFSESPMGTMKPVPETNTRAAYTSLHTSLASPFSPIENQRSKNEFRPAYQQTIKSLREFEDLLFYNKY